jgi:hypothetical protein
MVYRGVSGPWVISSLGAFTAKAGSGTLTLTVDGKERAQVNVTGVGMLRAAITPVTVAPGQVVKVRSSGLSIQNVVADTAWGRLMGLHLTTSPWRVEGEPNFSHAAPVYALPAYNGTNALMRTDPRLHRAGRVARKHARATKHKHARRARTHGRARDTQLRAR